MGDKIVLKRDARTSGHKLIERTRPDCMVRSWLFFVGNSPQTGLGSADYFEKLYLKVTNGRLIERRDHLFIGRQNFFAIPQMSLWQYGLS